MSIAVAAHRTPTAVQPQTSFRSPRLVYLDNLKTFLIAGIIAAHAATFYIGGSRWLAQEGAVGSTLITVIGAAGLAGALFWIGFFFLIAGLLAPDALSRHGARQFLRDRLLRLGTPLAAYIFLVMPLLHYVSYVATYTGAGGPKALWTWLTTGGWSWDAGPLWFVADLLLFSAVYACWWRLRPHRDTPNRPLQFRSVMAVACAVAAGCFVIHLVFPLFTRQFLDVHLSEFAQYTLLFWFGTVLARRWWVQGLFDTVWRRCGELTLAALVALIVVGVASGAVSGQIEQLRGGWHWEALATAGIEGALGVGGCLWLLEYFRRAQNRSWPMGQPLSRSAYAAYVVHQPFLIAFALIVDMLDLPVELRVLILAPTLVITSFAVAWVLVVRLGIAGRIL